MNPNAPTPIEIRQVVSSAERKQFIRFPNTLFRDDPAYVAPLEFELEARLDPAKNPGLKNSQSALWLAFRDGEPVGRISAIVNAAHLERYGDAAGHFGFLDAIDDDAVFDALMETASAWLVVRGMKKIAGPFNFSVNEECGVLVSGFETAPYIMMPHGMPYYQSQLERMGLVKAMDMHALEWLPRLDFIPEKRLRFIEKAITKPNIYIRNIDFNRFEDDIRIVVDIYDDAWSDNWGFIPFSEDHIRHMASELRPILQKHNVVLCYYDDEPVAFGLVLPNINYAIRDFNGKLLPFNWAKLLWRLKVQGIPQSRMPLMGVRKSMHKKPVGAAFAYKIIEMVNRANIEHGVTHSELSWILDNNESMLAMLLDMGATIYKTYRIYEKPL